MTICFTDSPELRSTDVISHYTQNPSSRAASHRIEPFARAGVGGPEPTPTPAAVGAGWGSTIFPSRYNPVKRGQGWCIPTAKCSLPPPAPLILTLGPFARAKGPMRCEAWRRDKRDGGARRGILSVMAFHEKAGRSQVDSFVFSLNTVFSLGRVAPLSPPFHPHSSLSDFVRSVPVGCSRFSRCCHLLVDLSSIFVDRSWARPLTQSPKLGFGLLFFPFRGRF